MRWILTIALVAVLIFILGRALLVPQQAAQLRLGYSQEAPYAYLNENAELTGIFVTAAEQVTAGMDVKQVDWLLHDFFQLFGSLQQKRIDVIAAGITITPERAENLCFTEPLLQAHSALLVLANSDIETNYSAADQTIAVIANSVEHQTLATEGYSRGCSIFCVSLVTGRYERLSAPRSVSTAVTASDSSFAPGVSNAQMPARYRHKVA